MKKVNSLSAKFLTAFILVVITGQAQDHKEKIRTALQLKIDSVRQVVGIPAMAFSALLPSGDVVTVSSGMDPSHRMLAGSTGKTFFAALALKTVAERKLSLDDPVSKFLGQIAWYNRLPNAGTITIRMLMNHTSGIEEYYPLGDFIPRLRSDPDKNWTPEECIAYVLDRTPLFEAGKGWSYADTNYLILGMVLEQVRGSKAYADIDRLVIIPNRFTATEPSVNRKIPRFVAGITTPENAFGLREKMVVNDSLVINPQMEWAGGGYVSNTIDLARWSEIYYHSGLYGSALAQEQRKGVAAKTGREHQYGLGVQIRPSALGTSYGHGGWFPGYLTEMDYFPEKDLGVCVQLATDDFKVLKRSPRAYEMFFAAQTIKLFESLKP